MYLYDTLAIIFKIIVRTLNLIRRTKTFNLELGVIGAGIWARSNRQIQRDN